jgi:thymidylate synthase
MKSYLDLLTHVMDNGEDREDRTGVGTRGVFGYQWRHNLATGFPLLTTKKVFWKGIVVELLWFLRGDTNIKFLHEHNVTIWDEWADKDGNLGPVYGAQWRFWVDARKALAPATDAFLDGTSPFAPVSFGTIDQIANLVRDLRDNPFSRRHIVSAWNPSDVPHMKLPPCHTLWQCHVSTSRRLNLHLYARSIDSFLGLPFNIASYALLNMILARVAGLTPGELVISFGDLHIYKNHFDQVKEQLGRTPRPLPTVQLSPYAIALEHFQPDSFALIDYDPHPAIKAPIAI